MTNELKVFESTEFGSVRVVEKEGEPWFVAKDVCDCLEIRNTAQALSYLDDDEQTIITNDSLTTSRNPNVSAVSEPGLYSLILRSRKPEAKAFIGYSDPNQAVRMHCKHPKSLKTVNSTVLTDSPRVRTRT